MFCETTVVCPKCSTEATFVHTFREQPVVGGCEACGTDYVTGFTGRNMIEHRRPKLIPDWDYYDPMEED